MSRRRSTYLASLTGLTPSVFFRRHWPDRVRVAHGLKSAALQDLLRRPELRSIGALSSAPRSGPAEAYSFQDDGQTLREVNPSANRLVEAFNAGWTIVVLNLETSIMKKWNAGLDRELGLWPGTARVNVFTSLPGRGFGWHWDAAELFIVQVRGRKIYDIAPNGSVEWPTMQGPEIGANTHPLLPFQLRQGKRRVELPKKWRTIEMRPGSVMFLPRGYWHRAFNVEECLHLTFETKPPTWRTVLNRMLSRSSALSSLDWRRPSDSLRPENLAEHGLVELKARLAELSALAATEGLKCLGLAEFARQPKRKLPGRRRDLKSA